MAKDTLSKSPKKKHIDLISTSFFNRRDFW